MITRTNSCMLRYAMILSIRIVIYYFKDRKRSLNTRLSFFNQPKPRTQGLLTHSDPCACITLDAYTTRIEAFLAIFPCANNFHRGRTGKCSLQTFPFLRRVTNKAHIFVITCLKLAFKIVGVSRICCFFNRTR